MLSQSVTFRNSTFVYKGKAVVSSEVADALGVRYLLEGSVRREGTATTLSSAAGATIR